MILERKTKSKPKLQTSSSSPCTKIQIELLATFLFREVFGKFVRGRDKKKRVCTNERWNTNHMKKYNIGNLIPPSSQAILTYIYDFFYYVYKYIIYPCTWHQRDDLDSNESTFSSSNIQNVLKKIINHATVWWEKKSERE